MQLATIVFGDGQARAALIDEARGVVPAEDVLDGAFADAGDVIRAYTADEVTRLLAEAPDAAFVSAERLDFAAPIPKPRMIWGIGLNYVEHAGDLDAVVPVGEPASFMKGDQTVIRPGDPIPLPWQSERVTAEAELGLIIGRECRNVTAADALDYVWGVAPVLDQTAEDILAKNPRYLTRAKNFPGFFCFGPVITPMAQVLARFGDIGRVEVATMLNGTLHRKNTVDQMMFPPADLVSFHSQVMPLFPGDIIATGTPGAVQIRPGDVAECRIEGIGALLNPVEAGSPRP